LLYDGMDLDEAEAYFSRQAAWTAPMRRHVYRVACLKHAGRALDVGCGTGEITEEIRRFIGGSAVGVDSFGPAVGLARQRFPETEFLEADAQRLPFDDASFDAVACHFFLMWASDPGLAVGEMARVLGHGGVLLVLSEPDYGGLVEYPVNAGYAEALERGLELSGAEPRIGRQVYSLLRAAGLAVTGGVSATPWEGDLLREEFEASRPLAERDLARAVGPDEASVLLERERSQAASGKLLMVPLFWAVARKP